MDGADCDGEVEGAEEVGLLAAFWRRIGVVVIRRVLGIGGGCGARFWIAGLA